MLSLNATQQAIVAATSKKVIWLVEIDTNNDGTPEYRYTGETISSYPSYLPKLLDFTPITVQKPSPESNIIPVSKTTIRISNKDNTIDPSTLEGADVKIRLVMQAGAYSNTGILSFGFVVISATSILQTISLECEDFLAGSLRGNYPNTRLVSDLFPYPNAKNDNACVPIAFGTPFFPVRWVPFNQDVDYIDSTHFDIAGDQTALFSAGQFLYSYCGGDGRKACYVDASATASNCLTVLRNGTNNPGAIQTIPTEVGATYRVTIYPKAGSEATVQGQLVDLAAEFEAGADWGTAYTFDKVATSTSHALILLVKTSVSVYYAQFDRISVRKVNDDGSLGPNLVTNGQFHAGITGWAQYNNATLNWGSGGMASTRVTLTADSDDLTANLTTVQTEHYLLGESETYTVSEARSPKEQGSKTVFTVANGYTFKQDTITGSDGTSYKAVQLIDDDSNIYFVDGQAGRHDVPFLFSRSDLSTTTNPADIVDYILQDIGIASAKIDSTSQGTAADTFDTNGLSLDVGLYFQQSREKLLSKLMALGGLILIPRDKIYYKILTATSQATLDKSDILPGTFNLQKRVYRQDQKDSAYLLWTSDGEPQDTPNKSLISLKSGTSQPASDCVECEWVDGSLEAKQAGKLALQKKLLPEKEATFRTFLWSLALEVGDVITIDDDDLGGTYNLMIDKITYDQKGTLGFTCTKFRAALDDWGDLSESDTVVYETNQDKGYSQVLQGPTGTTAGPNQITGAVLVGDGGEFKTNLNPSVNGGFLATNEALTCYNTSGAIRFQAVYAGTDQGDVVFGDYAGSQGVQWDQSAGKLDIKGRFTAVEGTIGGWTLDSSKIYQANAHLASAGYISFGSSPPSSYGDNVGAFLGYSSGAKLSLYADANNFLKWDGSKLLVKGANFELDSSGNLMASGGTIAGWNIGAASISKINANAGLTLNSTIPAVVCTDGSNYERVRLGFDGTNYGLTVRDESNNVIININDANKNISGWTVDDEKLYNTNSYISSASFISFGNTPPTAYGNNAGVWLGWTAGLTAKAQLSLYSDANNYLQFDGAKCLIRAANFTLDASGNITASSATVSGQITATSGTLGGFTAGATTLTGGTTNIVLDASNKAISIKDSTFGNDGIQLQYNSGNPRIYAGDGANEYLKWDGTSVKISSAAAAAIEIKGGGDITLTGSDTNPGRINFAGTSYSAQVGLNATGTIFAIHPNTNEQVDLMIGTYEADGIPWEEHDKGFKGIYIRANETANLMTGNADNNNFAQIILDRSSSYIEFNVYDWYNTPTLQGVRFNVYSGFFPLYNKITNLGGAVNAWDEAYADNWNNVADFFFLDHRREFEKLVPVDDVEVIKAIQPSGVFDSVTGMEIIDDDTLPEWLLSKCKKTGEVLRDPDGKPYLSLKTMISLLMGAIRQLDKKISNNHGS